MTGHTGFKGAWLSAWLSHAGAQLTGYALPPDSEPSMYDLIGDKLRMTSVLGDLRSMQQVEEVVRRCDPEIVVHMGAQALVRRSYRDPVETYATNVMGTINVLDALRRLARPKAVIVVTTDKCYDNKEWVWPYREDDPLGGYDVYSSSKACADIATASFRSAFFSEMGAGLASARAGNVIGGGDWSEDRLVPDLVRSFSQATPAVLRNPQAIRPWQHVLDALSGYILLAQRLYGNTERFGEAWNFGPDVDQIVTVERVTDLVCKAWGDGVSWTLDQGANPHEAHLLKLDSSKARAALGWQPRLDLVTSIQWSVDWYRTAAAAGDVVSLTFEQIEAYEASKGHPL